MLSECNRRKATNLCANVKTGISFFFSFLKKREIMSQSGLLSQPRPLCSSSSEGNGPRCVCPHADWKKRAIPMDAFHLIAMWMEPAFFPFHLTCDALCKQKPALC